MFIFNESQSTRRKSIKLDDAMIGFKRINRKICHFDISARENTGMTDTDLYKMLRNFNAIHLIYYGLYKIALSK